MTRLAEIWKAYGDDGFSAIRSIPADTFAECFYLSVLAFREGMFESAHAFAEKSSKRRPESLVATESTKLLRRIYERHGEIGLLDVGTVMFGNFDHDSDRMTFEQSMELWTSDLESAGFSDLRRHLISRYWWADSYLVEAACD